MSQVHFPSFSNSPNLLLSGGNDEKIVLWDYNTSQNGFHSNAAAALHATSFSDGYMIRSINKHGSKINWIKSYTTNKNLVYIADLSNQITIYEVVE